MYLLIYQGGRLAAIFEYGKTPTYFGRSGEDVRTAVEVRPPATPKASLIGGLADRHRWAASVVGPALKAGMLVRYLPTSPQDRCDVFQSLKPFR